LNMNILAHLGTFCILVQRQQKSVPVDKVHMGDGKLTYSVRENVFLHNKLKFKVQINLLLEISSSFEVLINLGKIDTFFENTPHLKG